MPGVRLKFERGSNVRNDILISIANIIEFAMRGKGGAHTSGKGTQATLSVQGFRRICHSQNGNYRYTKRYI